MSVFFGRTRLRYSRGASKAGVLALLVSFSALTFVGVRVFEIVSGPSWGNGGWRSDMEGVLGAREISVPILPSPESPQKKDFTWRYHGKTYTLEATLYDSLYEFYRSLPTGVPLASGAAGKDTEWWTRLNALFLRAIDGDSTVPDIARAIRRLGEQNSLDENQLVELVAAFVQSIPYDQGKTDRRETGLDGISEKTTYPYEVLYDQTGVCQDKSYLAYRILQELGMGVSIFLFPDPRDNHMAVGVRCPSEYANYDSGYCFLETTGTGNKIGTIPSLVSASRVATAQIEIGDVLDDRSEERYQALGRVEILNEAPGKEYTGIIDTLKTRDRLERLREDIAEYKRQLRERKSVVASEEEELDRYDSRLAKLKREERYEEYNALVKSYNRLVTKLERDIASYNDLVEKSNQAISQYNKESKLFYE